MFKLSVSVYSFEL